VVDAAPAPAPRGSVRTDGPVPDRAAAPPADPEGVAAGIRAAYLLGADPVDLAGLDPADVGTVAGDHARFASVRAPGQTLLRVRPADPDRTSPAPTVIEIVTDDMPFLVDSITAALARVHATTRVLLHPRPVVARDADGVLVGIGDPAAPPVLPRDGRSGRESWIRVQTRPLEAAGREQLEQTLRSVLSDVRAADEDTWAMRDRALALAAELDADPPVGLDPVEVAEAAELLTWLADDYWTFIGYREYRYGPADPDESSAGAAETGVEQLTPVEGTGLGVLRGTDSAPRPLPAAAARRAAEPTVLVLTKTNRRSTVSRPAHLDYVGVKSFDDCGRVVGERRFLGLFPPEDRGGWVLDVPVARRRARQVLAAIGADADSHDGVGVLQILGSLPRSELLASGVPELTTLARETLRLMGRRGVRVFARTEPYGRFLSFVVCLAGLEDGAGAVAAVEAALAEATGGIVDPPTSAVVGSGVVRLHCLVRPAALVRPGSERAAGGGSGAAVPGELTVPDLGAIEAGLLRRLADWRADLSDLLSARFGERGESLAARWVPTFPAAYREDVAPADALADVFALDELTEPGAPDLAAALVPPPGPAGEAAGQTWRFTLYRRGTELSLSAVLPVLSGLGVEVTDERPYRIRSAPSADADASSAGNLWVFTFRLHLPVQAGAGAAPTLPWRFAEAFLASFAGTDDSDGLAALVVSAGLDRQAVGVLRLYLRWLRQTGWTFGDDYARGALLADPAIAAMLVELFAARFDPDVPDPDARGAAEDSLRTQVLEALEGVSALDSDRIIRRLLTAIGATVRTNAFARETQGGRAPGAPDPERPLVIVLDPTLVAGLPHPVPWREIFVSSAAVEGIHLRFGPVARGGLRWSDRPEDFRTEILGLAKAQTVKNTVIVPTGAKGGFVVRRPAAPTGDAAADRDAFAAAGRACYELFIGGLLDVVDTLETDAARGTRRVVHPGRTVCHDGEDSYLVVAADKGTATFSDIANGIAVRRGFWLGDAFASGGSAGFDHKRMGITAKGAWESVRRHFAELDLDADTAPITVVGIGDMSGDVFGNGMLLSHDLRLVAAFDHRHVFLDPDPDPAAAFAERTRLFALPRSSWADYDPAVISAGGGVFARTAKSLAISARAAAVLGIAGNPTAGGAGSTVVLTPEELVRAVLHAPVDLLFNGGIGTWVKASAEPHSAAGDRANDAVRANAADLRVKVIAEGGNLGMTQRGRIEFTRSGGRCNTDFVDNSAGVDTSDREVNLKILLGQAMAAGELAASDRDGLLESVTDEVATSVLRDNRSQNLASATESAQAASLVRAHAELARRLESAGLLERSVEAFPTDQEITALERAGAVLSVPELAVLSAWAKIWLTRDVEGAEPDVPTDPALSALVVDYLPPTLRGRFGRLAPGHPLAAGIAATILVNGVVDVAGPTFASRLGAELSVGALPLLLAHTAARAVLGTDELLDALADAPGVPMSVAVGVRCELRTLVERVTRWLVRERGLPVDIDAVVRAYRGGVREVALLLPGLLPEDERRPHDEHLAALVSAGVPEAVAAAAAVAGPLFTAFAIVDLTTRTGRSAADVAAVHVGVGDEFGIAALVDAVAALPREDPWAARARGVLRDDLQRAQAAITARVLEFAGGSNDAGGLTAAELVAAWRAAADADRVLDVLAEAAGGMTGGGVAAEGGGDLARLVVATRAVSALARVWSATTGDRRQG
jgi:glutamate dehydrogenase